MSDKVLVSAKEVSMVAEVLGKLVLQAKYAHMKVPVDTIIGGLLLPNLVDQGAVSANDPAVLNMMDAYSKEKVKSQLNPQPISVEKILEITKERPVFRRIKDVVHKESRIQRELDPTGRDHLIRWWNANQRLIEKDDPVCVQLTEEVNAMNPEDEPLSAMQIAGYFSHLCRMGLRVEEDRKARFEASRRRGAHTVMPVYTQKVLDAIMIHWEKERAEEQQRIADHEQLKAMRAQGIYKPILAKKF